jgi:hypothetical protein
MIGSSRHRRRVKKNGPIAGAKIKEAIGRKENCSQKAAAPAEKAARSKGRELKKKRIRVTGASFRT